MYLGGGGDGGGRGGGYWIHHITIFMGAWQNSHPLKLINLQNKGNKRLFKHRHVLFFTTKKKSKKSDEILPRSTRDINCDSTAAVLQKMH